MPRLRNNLLAALAASLLMSAPGWGADFRLLVGHGGPVMAVEVSGDGTRALTASFDNSVGLWDLASEEVIWLEGHEAAVKAITFLPGGRAASAGDDFAIEVWDLSNGESLARLTGHTNQIAALAVSPDGRTLASASWDRSIRLWSLEDYSVRVLSGHEAPVNDVAFLAEGDGSTLYSASADGTVRTWDTESGQETRQVLRHGFGINTFVLGDGWLAYGALDGGTRVIDIATDELIADLTLERRPILSMALSPGGDEISVGDGEGYVMSVDTERWRIAHDYRAAGKGPVWALAYTGDGSSLISGGIDDNAYIWPVDNTLDAPIMATARRSFLRDPEAMSNGERQFQRKCSVCHSLTEDGARRAGPTLAGLFGREAGTVPGYTYSTTVLELGFAWSEETIDQLFDLGPDHFIPGSKMPMQVIARPEDRRDLIAFLKENT